MKSWLTAVSTLTLIGLPSVAFAWCRTTTCAAADAASEECNPGVRVEGCQRAGNALFWPKPCVSFSVQQDGSTNSRISADELEEVIRESFDHWQKVDCGSGSHPNISVEKYPRVECSEARYNQKERNQNVWIFRDDAWPHEGNDDRTIALTLVSFHPRTGEIYDVDVELNSFQRTFVLVPPSVESQGDDLYSVVQHESGHFLGLAHSSDGESTMWSNYNGSADMRTLESDDAEGICAAYPPTDTPDASCNAEPRHGFSTQCAESVESCSLSSRNRRRGAYGSWTILAAIALVATRSRNRSRRQLR